MTPLYRQIVDNIIKQIENNEYLPNEKLPSERDLAELYGVNRMTVKKAMDMLVEMEYLYRDVGRGTFVKNRMTMKKAMNMLADKGYFNQNTGQIFFTKETKSKQLLYPAGFLPYDGGISVQKTSSEIRHSSKVIFSGFLRDWPAMCARLRLGDEQSIFTLHLIRYGDGEPLGVEYSYIPAAYFEDAQEQKFNQVSLYDYMNAKGHAPIYFEDRLTIIQCPPRESKLLKLCEGEGAVYHFGRLGRNASGQMIEYTHSYIKSSDVKFEFSQFRSSF